MSKNPTSYKFRGKDKMGLFHSPILVESSQGPGGEEHMEPV